MFVIESQQGVENNVKLLRDAEFIPTSNGHFLWFGRVRVPQTFFQIEWLDKVRNPDLTRYSSSSMRTELPSITNQEAVWRFDLNLEWFFIDLNHALDFFKCNCIAVIESVLLFFMKTHQSSFFLSDSSNMDRLALLACAIKYYVVFSKIDESESIES